MNSVSRDVGSSRDKYVTVTFTHGTTTTQSHDTALKSHTQALAQLTYSLSQGTKRDKLIEGDQNRVKVSQKGDQI